jgi:hypothetical protein
MRSRAIVTLSLCIVALAGTGCMTAFAAFQPENIGGETIVLTSTDAEGNTYDRVLSPIDQDGQLFVAANHWPRAWYRRAMENAEVSATIDDATADYRAVRVTGVEEERVKTTNPLPFFFRVLTGFPPRHIVRLDPASDAAAAEAS